MRSTLFVDGVCRNNLTAAEIGEVLKSTSDAVLWADFPAIDEDAQRVLRDVFGFHSLAIDDCSNGRVDTPKIDDYQQYLFIVAQSVVYHNPSDQLELAEVDIFLGDNYVVTVREAAIPAIDALFETGAVNPHLFNRGADFLAHTIIDGLVDLLLPAVEEMDETLDLLERRILANPDKRLLGEVMLLKRNTLRLRRSILPERDMVNRLSRGEFGELIDKEALIFYRDIYDHIVRVEEMLDGLRDLADSALSSYLSAVNNRLNEVMKAMSVVAVIFLPLTLIASIYGTNLDYSQLGLTFNYGFFLMVAVMVAVAAALVAYFRKQGWF